MQRWEYSYLLFTDHSGVFELLGKSDPAPCTWPDHHDAMKQKGRAGWECYAVISSGAAGMTFFFKRPLTGNPGEN